jgi:hypothetical protein
MGRGLGRSEEKRIRGNEAIGVVIPCMHGINIRKLPV